MTAITADPPDSRAPVGRNCTRVEKPASRVLPLPYSCGSRVLARSDCWRVKDLRTFDDCALVALTAAGSAERPPVTLIVPADVIEPAGRQMLWRRTALARGCAVLAQALRSVLGAPPLPLAPLATLGWQFAAARAFVAEGSTRVLLADEVGLGKTVQAALAVHALSGAGKAARVLVLTPAGLRDQWRDELARLFGWRSSVADTRELRLRRIAVAVHVNPWLAPGLTIASLDFVKQPEVLAACRAVPWDLLIVDEAHALAPGTDRLAAAEALGRTARRVLLLTATPHSGDDEAFEAMCGVGSIAGDPAPLAVIRRTAAAIGRGRPRRLCLLRVRESPAERRVHLLLDRYVRLVWDAPARVSGPARLLAMTVLLKRAASSMTALARSLDHRIRCLEEGVPLPLQKLLPFEDPGEVNVQDADLPESLAAPGLADRAAEVALLHDLLAAATDAQAADAKRRLVARLLRRMQEPLLVFTEYRDTLHAIHRCLAAGVSAAVLHGGMNRQERGDAVRAFAGGRLRVLVATDVAAEGLNLHEHCRVLVNVELPWTPTRLEQRVGRVDRLGQSRRVHVIHLLRRAGVEPWLGARLAARAARARRSLGGDGHAAPADDITTTARALELKHSHAMPPWRDARDETGGEGSLSLEVEAGARDDRAAARQAGRDRLGSNRPVPGIRFDPRRSGHAADGLSTAEAARVRLADALRRAALARSPGVAGPCGESPRYVCLSRRMARRLDLPAGVTFIVRTSSRAAGEWSPVPLFAAVAIALDWKRAPRRLSAIVERLAPLARTEAARRGGALDEDRRSWLRVTAASLARERAILVAATLPTASAAPVRDTSQPSLFDRRVERHRAAIAEAERQRVLLHESYASSFEADLDARPDASAEPFIAFVVR